MPLSKIQTSEMLDAPNLGRRNLVINGAMQVAQRSTSSTGNTVGGYKSVDRFISEFTTLGTWTVSQSTDAPAGFANSLDHTCTTGKASPASQDTFRLSYRFEGQDLQHLQKGTSSAKSCTISFWIKSNKTGTGQINIRDIDNNRGINKTYTIDAANTWEYKTILIEGDTTGTISNDNGSSFWLMWAFYSGTDNNSGTFNDAWGAWSWTAVNASGTLDIGASASDYVKITGVQLEVGDTATDFEHRSFGEELSLCQRYFCKSYNYEHAPGTNTSYGTVYSRLDAAVSNRPVSVSFPVTLRDSPTIALYSIIGTSGSVSDCSTNYNHVSDDTASISGVGGGTTGFSAISGIGATAGDIIGMHFTAESEL